MRLRRLLATLLLVPLLGLDGPDPAAATPGEADLTGVVDAQAGNTHSCVRVTGGQLRCWGGNEYGQVGDGTTTSPRLAPVAVKDGLTALTGVTQVSVGFHTCARLTSGQARCWGANFEGELGDGSTTQRSLPVTVRTPRGPLGGVAEVRAGDAFSCARLTSGQVRCWGTNDEGQIADGTTTDRHRATTVTVPGGAPLTGVTQLSVGRFHACARLQDTTVRCWGDGASFALGTGSTTPAKRARRVLAPTGTGPLRDVRSVSAGDLHTCAVLLDGQVRCWGANGFGQVGDGSTTYRRRPRVVVNPTGTGRLRGVAAVSASQGFTCARRTNGTARCWGAGGDGTLGDGGFDDHPRPRVVRAVGGGATLTGVTRLQAGGAHVCARRTGGTAVCWGAGFVGQLGDGNLDDQPLPVVVQLP